MRRFRMSFISGRRGSATNAALAQRARAPFRAALIPAQNFSVGDVAGRGFDEWLLFELFDRYVFARSEAPIDARREFRPR